MSYRISDHINRFQSCLWQLNSTHIHYLNTSLIIDPAYTNTELQAITEAVLHAGWPVRYLGFTHGDFDHVVGNNWFDGFTSIGSTAMHARKDKERVIRQITDFDEEHYIERPYPVKFPDLDILVESVGLQELMIGDINTHIYNAGGHTADGLFYIFPDQRLWVAGDYLSDIEFPFIEDDIKEYYATLAIADQILNEYDIDFMIPGHGNIAFTKSDIHERIDNSRKYLDSMSSNTVVDWRISWGASPFDKFLDKMHKKNIDYVRSQNI